MAIVLESNYSKKLGLPGYSSHQYSITIRTEITDPGQVAAESSRLYDLLQGCVDSSIQKVGFLPDSRNGNGHSNATPNVRQGNGNGQRTGSAQNDNWACSPRQKNLILRIVQEHALDKNHVEALAQDRFGKSVRALTKLEASALIDELFLETGRTPTDKEWDINSRRDRTPTP